MKKKLSILFFIFCMCFALTLVCNAQQSYNNTIPSNSKILISDSGNSIIVSQTFNCKNTIFEKLFFYNKTFYQSPQDVIVTPSIVANKPRNLIIHGNISYDYFYRSRIDTPFNQQDFRQHTEKIYLDILLKQKYPLKVNFTSRQSNSPFFKNFIDVNFNFDKYNFDRNLKQQLLEKLKGNLQSYKYPELEKLVNKYKKIENEYNKTKSWIEDPGTLQKIIEEREKEYYKKLKLSKDSLENNTGQNDMANLSLEKKKNSFLDSINHLRKKANNIEDNLRDKTEPIAKSYELKKKSLDSLKLELDKSSKKIDSMKNSMQNYLVNLKQKIYKSNSEKELRKLAKENGIEMDKYGKFEKRLASIKTLNIGRSILNYTELTAQNITISGINVEYNPSYYAALSAGKIDYRFRDFSNRASTNTNQYIIMGRFGLGDREHKSLIFSYFTGRKNSTNYNSSDSVNSSVNILGYSVEASFKINDKTSFSAEFAKSTKPVSGNLQANKQNGSLVKFDDKSNMGINIKAQTTIEKTKTRLSGFFRKTGENFQSFSLFSYNTDQTAWLARADQSLLKNKINFIGMLRRNDFTNPFTDKTYKTTTVFKSIQLNVRFPKYPSVSIGYYPGTQLFLIDKERIRESAYYILNGSVVYSYFFKGLAMNSSVIYNKYTSEATDSGFVAYKGINYYASQSIFFKKLQVQTGYAFTKQPQLEYHSFEGSGNYEINDWLKFGIAAKLNHVAEGKNYFGESLQFRANFKSFGGIQFQYEKSFIPTIISQTLYPVEIGRVSYYKNF